MKHRETDTPPEWLTVQEVAKALRTHPTTIRRWIRCGALPAATLPRVGRNHVYRVERERVERLFAARTP